MSAAVALRAHFKPPSPLAAWDVALRFTLGVTRRGIRRVLYKASRSHATGARLHGTHTQPGRLVSEWDSYITLTGGGVICACVAYVYLWE